MDFILLVDDSKVARMLISRGVAEAMPGLEIVEAVHAEDAIEKLTERGQAPKLTVIDYNMPGMTGLEFAGWMDTNWPGPPRFFARQTSRTASSSARRKLVCPSFPSPSRSRNSGRSSGSQPPKVMTLDSLHKDLLGEVFNLGAGRAAASLSELLGNDLEIGLSVPRTDVLTMTEMAELIQDGKDEEFCGVSLNHKGELSGDSFLVYTHKESMRLVQLLMGGGLGQEVGDRADFTDMHEDALLEVGNLVLNACLSSVANFLSLEFESDVPHLYSGDCMKIISNDGVFPVDQLVLYVQIAFSIEDEGLNGYMGLCLNMDAMASLETHLKHYIDTQLGA